MKKTSRKTKFDLDKWDLFINDKSGWARVYKIDFEKKVAIAADWNHPQILKTKQQLKQNILIDQKTKLCFIKKFIQQP